MITKTIVGVKEMSMGDVLQSELNAAQDEFWKARQELDMLLEDMTLVQRQKVNELVRTFKDSQSMM